MSVQENSRFVLKSLGAIGLYQVDEHGQAVQLLGPGKPLALLAYCCATRDREHSREFLSALLWSDSASARSRQSLRQALWRLRRLLGERLHVREDSVLGVDDSVECDRSQFLAAVHRGDAEDALRHYRGPYLVGLSAPGGDAFDDWASLERQQLEESLVRVVDVCARRFASAGRASHARGVLERLLAVTPDSVYAHRVAVSLFSDIGAYTEARRAADALEIQARSLEGRIPPDVEALISRARDSDRQPAIQTTLPLVLDLVGREGPFDSVISAWQRARGGDAQIVVINGVAGIGKSRLLAVVQQRCTTRRTRSVLARAHPGERDVPFGLVASVARELAALPGAAGVSGESASELVALDPRLGAHFSASASVDGSGEVVRRRALALLDLLEAIAEQHPLALLLDDWHWADSASRQVISIVLGRIAALPMMIVVTTRGPAAQLFDQPFARVLSLSPLAPEHVVDAVRSSGVWPENQPATRFVDTLAAVSEGIPLAVMERLSLVRERGLLTLDGGVWSSSNWDAATAEIEITSPLDLRLESCSPDERSSLLALAVAGTPLSSGVIARCAEQMSPAVGVSSALGQSTDLPKSTSALDQLEVKGLVVRVNESWTLVHDVVGERLLVLVDAGAAHRTHLLLAEAFAASTTRDGIARAVRHFLLAGDDRQAGRQLARLVARARAAGDLRPAQDLLAALSVDDVSEMRWRVLRGEIPLRLRMRGLRARQGMAVFASMAMISVLSSWIALKRPVLLIVQSATTSVPISSQFLAAADTIEFGRSARRTSPSILLSLGADTAGGNAPTFVRAIATSSGTRILAGDSVRIEDGVAAFNQLRFISEDSVSVFRFEANGYRSVSVPLRRNPRTEAASLRESRLRMIDGELHAQRISTTLNRIAVRTGDSINGVVHFEYSSPLNAASVWLSLTTTWGDPRQEAREISPLLTPVQRERIAVPVSVRAPTRSGHYWILFLAAAEPEGLYGLSRTNWSMKRDLWGDGNDIAALPDSVIQAANQNGIAFTEVAYPIARPIGTERCVKPDQHAVKLGVRYCTTPTLLWGIEVNVR